MEAPIAAQRTVLVRTQSVHLRCQEVMRVSGNRAARPASASSRHRPPCGCEFATASRSLVSRLAHQDRDNRRLYRKGKPTRGPDLDRWGGTHRVPCSGGRTDPSVKNQDQLSAGRPCRQPKALQDHFVDLFDRQRPVDAAHLSARLSNMAMAGTVFSAHQRKRISSVCASLASSLRPAHAPDASWPPQPESSRTMITCTVRARSKKTISSS